METNLAELESQLEASKREMSEAMAAAAAKQRLLASESVAEESQGQTDAIRRLEQQLAEAVRSYCSCLWLFLK